MSLCVVTMFWHHMTDHSSVVNMQVYSCWMQTYMQSRMATLHHHCCIGLWYWECAACITKTDTLKCTVCHIRLYQVMFFVFMLREERHWSNKSCSYLCPDPVQHPATASHQTPAGKCCYCSLFTGSKSSLNAEFYLPSPDSLDRMWNC